MKETVAVQDKWDYITGRKLTGILLFYHESDRVVTLYLISIRFLWFEFHDSIRTGAFEPVGKDFEEEATHYSLSLLSNMCFLEFNSLHSRCMFI